MNEKSIFNLLENYKQKPGINYFADHGNVNGIDGLWATYFLAKGYMMTGFFNEDKLLFLSLENNVFAERNPLAFLEGVGKPWVARPKIDVFERSFCLELMGQREPLLEGLNPEKLDVFALGEHIGGNIDSLCGFLTETCLRDPNTPVSRGELLRKLPFVDDVRMDVMCFLMGETEKIRMSSVTKEEALAKDNVKLDLESVKIEVGEKNPILQYSDGECEVVLTKAQGKYEVETRKADLEYAGAKTDPNFSSVLFSEPDACLAFSRKCAELARNVGRNDSAVFLVQRAAYKKAQEILLGGRTGNGGESVSPPEKPKKKPKTMER